MQFVSDHISENLYLR